MPYGRGTLANQDLDRRQVPPRGALLNGKDLADSLEIIAAHGSIASVPM